MGRCGFFCGLGRLIKKVSKTLSDAGLLPPFVNVALQSGGNLLGAGNSDTPTQSTTQQPSGGFETARQNSLGRVKYHHKHKIGEIPKVF